MPNGIKTGQFKLSRPFSEQAQNDILEQFRTLEKDLNDSAKMGADGIHKWTADDLRLANFTFQMGGKVHRLKLAEGDPADRTKKAKNCLRELSGENTKALQVLSTVVGKRALAAQIAALNEDFPANGHGFYWFQYPNEGTHPAPACDSFEYGIKQNKDGDIIVTLDYYHGGSELTDEDRTIPIKTGPDPTQPVGSDNYAIKCSVAIQLKAADVAEGLINPSFVGKPMVSMQFTPDLGRLEQVR